MPHWMLTLDASTPVTVVAVGSPGAPAPAASVSCAAMANQTSEKLGLHIQRCLDDAGISPRDLTHVCCGVGPGTFTGTRVTVALAKGLATGLGLPIHPVSTLHALACEVDGPGARRIWAMLDARRGEVYVAGYTSTREAPMPDRVVSPRCCSVASLREDTAGICAGDVVIGTGVAPYRDLLSDLPAASLLARPGLNVDGLWRASRDACNAAPVHARDLRVHYLRASYAEMGIHAPKKPMIKSPFVDP